MTLTEPEKLEPKLVRVYLCVFKVYWMISLPQFSELPAVQTVSSDDEKEKHDDQPRIGTPSDCPIRGLFLRVCRHRWMRRGKQ